MSNSTAIRSSPASGGGSPAGDDPSATAGTGQLRWIKGPWMDLLVGCGAWTLPLAALVLYLSREHFVTISIAFYALAVFCNNPHYMATIYRAYGTRGDFQKYRFFTVYLTVFMVLTAVLVHMAPSLLPWLFTLYFTWSPWHYTGQNYGIAMLFIRRNGGAPDRLTRNLFYGSFVASYLVWFLSMHSAAQEHPFTVSLGIPANIADAATLVCVGAFLACGGWSLWRLAAGIGWRRLLPAAVLFSTQFLWFVASAILRFFQSQTIPPVYYALGILAFMHCAQYLWITGYYTRRETEAGTRGRNRTWRPLRYYAILVIGGLALFLPGPWLVSTVFRQDFTISYLIFVSLINLHHFILDGAIWKLRDGRISRLLLGNRTSTSSETPAHTDAHDHLESPDPVGTFFRWLSGRSTAGRLVRVSAIGALLILGTLDQLQFFWTQSQPALDRLARAMFLNPADTRIYNQRARLFEQDGRIPEAIAQLEEASLLSPDNPAIHKNLARMLTRAGRYDEAEDIWRRFENRFSRDYNTLLLRGSTLEHLQAPERAAEVYRAALRANPDGLQAALQLVDLAMAGDAPEEAAPYCQKVLEILDRPQAWAGLPPEATHARHEIVSRVAMQLGDLRRTQQRPDQALEAYVLSAEHARLNDNAAALSAAASRAAQACADQGQIVDMLGWTAEAVRAGSRTSDPFLSGVAWFNLALTLDRHARHPDQFLDAAAAAAAAAHFLGEDSEAAVQARELSKTNLQRARDAGSPVTTEALPQHARQMLGL